MTMDNETANYHAQFLLETLAPSLEESGMTETAIDVKFAAKIILELIRKETTKC